MKEKNNHTAKCPDHNKEGQFIPPNKVDKKRQKLIVNFKCPDGHIFTKEFDLK